MTTRTTSPNKVNVMASCALLFIFCSYLSPDSVAQNQLARWAENDCPVGLELPVDELEDTP